MKVTTLLSFASLAVAFRPFSGHNEIAKDQRKPVPGLGTPKSGSVKGQMKSSFPKKESSGSSQDWGSSSVDCDRFVPVEQDGSDVSYYINTYLGSSQDAYRMVLDTGSYYMWVYSENCTSDACMRRNRFGVDNSTSIESTGQTFSISYTSGNIDGDIVIDNMTIGATTTRTQFGTANQADPNFANFAIDGILGLSAIDKSESSFPSLISVLKAQNQISKRIFGVSLGRSADNTEGALILGDYDHAAVSGDISWVNILSGTALWKVLVDGAFVGGNQVDFGGSRNAIVDTGTTLLVMPPADAMKFHGYIPGSQTDGTNFAIPCDSTVQVEIDINGIKWEISSKDYVGFRYTDNSGLCASNIQGLKTGSDDKQWILGAVFLKNVYTIFDMDSKRVGFAHKQNSDVNKKCNKFVEQYQSNHKYEASKTSSGNSQSSSSISASATISAASTSGSSQSSTKSLESNSPSSSITTKLTSSASMFGGSNNTTLSNQVSSETPATTGNATMATSTESTTLDSAAATSSMDTASANSNAGSLLKVNVSLMLIPFIFFCM